MENRMDIGFPGLFLLLALPEIKMVWIRQAWRW
jgi:hypothetical protein